MSVVETTGAASTADAQAERNWSRMVASRGARAARVPRLRLVRSELGMVFRRRRNQVALGMLGVIPVVIAFAVKASGGSPARGGDGPMLLDQVTHNGVFVAFAALAAVVPLLMPLAIAVVAGDAVAGESSLGTLRYLLTVPVGRTRLLGVKYTAVVAFCVCAALLVAAVGAGVGLLLFGSGSAALLSGTPIGVAGATWRLLLVALYVTACMAAVGAIGLFFSTLVESPVAAMAATAGTCIASQILGAVQQIHVIHPYLPSNYWLGFGDLLRDPIATDALRPGLVSAAVYVALFLSMAWARFGGKDVTS
jgi:ABC-2 type transport system permease protein